MDARRIVVGGVAAAGLAVILLGGRPAEAGGPMPVRSASARGTGGSTSAYVSVPSFAFGPFSFDFGFADAWVRRGDSNGVTTWRCLPLVWGIRLSRSLPRTVSFDCFALRRSPAGTLPEFEVVRFSLEEGGGGHPGYVRMVGDVSVTVEANASPVTMSFWNHTSLTVESGTDGARIFVDNFDTAVFTGCGPVEPGEECRQGSATTFPVTPGLHRVRLVKDGYEPVEVETHVALMGTTSLRVELLELPLPGPAYTVETVVDGLTIPWDLAFAPDGTLLFTERPGRLNARLTDGSVRTLAEPEELLVTYETGLMGLALSPSFASDRAVFTCQSHAPTNTVQVVRWTVSADWTSASRDPVPVVEGIPAGAAGGGHAGCRVRFDATGQLLVGTGDAYVGTVPQDLTSLGGKVLRVDPATGEGAVDNPFASSANPDTRRVFTFGHRNVQGLALRPGGSGLANTYSVEHGPSWDDEINRLVPGGNYGWNPVPGYNQSVPMTDLVLFPDAVGAVWSSGAYSLATSGGTFIDDPAWGSWDGALVVGALKTTHLRIIKLGNDDEIVGQTSTLTGYGRLRTPVMGADGSLYVTTSNGEGTDKILRLTPHP